MLDFSNNQLTTHNHDIILGTGTMYSSYIKPSNENEPINIYGNVNISSNSVYPIFQINSNMAYGSGSLNIDPNSSYSRYLNQNTIFFLHNGQSSFFNSQASIHTEWK